MSKRKTRTRRRSSRTKRHSSSAKTHRKLSRKAAQRQAFTRASAVVATTAAVVVLILWNFPYEWPYDAIVTLIAMAGLLISCVLCGVKPLTAAVAFVAVFGALGVIHNTLREVAKVLPRTILLQEGAHIHGIVICGNGARVVGIYVRVGNDPFESGFAAWERGSRSTVARYTYEVTKGARFKVGVGCGGTPRLWRDSLSSRFTSSHTDFICEPGTSREHLERGCFFV